MQSHKIKRELADQLIAVGLNPLDVSEVVLRALHEDCDEDGDVTSVATIAAEQMSTLDFVARAPGVIAGMPVACSGVCNLGWFLDEHFHGHQRWRERAGRYRSWIRSGFDATAAARRAHCP